MIKKIIEAGKVVGKNVANKWDQVQSHADGGKGNIKVICHGGAESVTGSNFELQYLDGDKKRNGLRILIDAGLPQGLEAAHHEWEKFNFETEKIDYLLVTHAHMDHIGRIPFLFASGFNGIVYSTKATREMSEVAFADAMHINQKNFERGVILEMPYEERDIQHAMSNWKTIEYKQNLKLSEKVSATFFNSSHVLGSAFIQLNCAGEKVLFTGDMGANSLLLPEADIPTDSDIVFMETVYGGRVHEHLDDRTEFLKNIIEETISKRGTLVIPAFSIERTQEILKEINDFVEHKELPVLPVFLDSPLSISITKIFHKHFDMLSEKIKKQVKSGDDIFKFPGLHLTDSKDESISISRTPGPKIVIAGSGMVAGGRVIHHVRNYLEGRNNTILLAGYQAPGTYGRLLTENKKEIIFYGEHLQVNAKIAQLSGYSAHRDKNDLLKFVEIIKGNCKNLNLILGDAESLLDFKREVKNKLNIDAHICLKGETLVL